MKVIALVSQKGGSGKSTLAEALSCLAGEEGPALLVDRDQPQRTASKWWNRRQRHDPPPETPTLFDLGNRTLTETVAALRLRADMRRATLVIDTRPAVSQPESEAAQAADLVIVPVRPSPNDLEAVADSLTMLRTLGRPTVLVASACRNEARATWLKSALSRFKVPTCPHYVTDRTVFADAATEGRWVAEMKGSDARKAEAELRSVWAWIKEEAHA